MILMIVLRILLHLVILFLSACPANCTNCTNYNPYMGAKCTLCDARYVLYNGRCKGTVSKFLYKTIMLPKYYAQLSGERRGTIVGKEGVMDIT